MRVVIQNVLKASVSINDELYSSINKGYLILVGFKENDNEEIIDKIVEKIIKLRIFIDEFGKTNLSLKDVKGEVLSVSQFTLYANLKKGNRPSFIDAMKPIEASKLYDYFNKTLAKYEIKVKKGIFGEDMKVSLINDGPFTLVIDSEDLLK